MSTCAATVRPLPLFAFCIVPVWALSMLVVFPPHDLDLALARLFYNNGFVYQTDPLFEWFFHKALKGIPVGVVLVSLLHLIWVNGVASGLTHQQKRMHTGRDLYIIIALASSLALVSFLKLTTGVACPWSVTEFGGSASVTDPVWGLKALPGRCWPAGHASTGFCLFALYFAWRDTHPTRARWLAAAALLLGAVCGISRMMMGAHFASHTLATMLIDWLVTLGLYLLFRSLGARFCSGHEAQRTRLVRLEKSSLTWVIVLSGLWWTYCFNLPLLNRAFLHVLGQSSDWLQAAHALLFVGLSSVAVALASMACIGLLALLPRKIFIALLVLLHTLGALALVSELTYGTILTSDMLRNFISTDLHEATGYVSVRSTLTFALVLVPALIVALRCEARAWSAHSFWRQAGLRTLCAVACFALSAALLFTQSQTLSGLLRNDRALRYYLAPANMITATVKTLTHDQSPDRVAVHQVIDPRPVLGAAASHSTQPLLFVVVVGETARSANWQAAGYARETTPQLKTLSAVHMPHVRACGTSTDVSLPCMFSRVGRHDYDRARILHEEALPALIQRAGYSVQWIDNQSGCKGVCADVPTRQAKPAQAYCADGQCTDDVLVQEIGDALAQMQPGDKKVLFLHMLGSHGPAYFHRSTQAAKRFLPECRDPDLASCARESIVNAYDNSLLVTDRVLANIIGALAARKDLATGLVFVSDHGESLGEKGLYLHGAPWMFAPSEQTDVPGLWWFSPNWERAMAISSASLQQHLLQTAPTHDHLFHTLLSVLDVKTRVYDPRWDLLAEPQS